MDEWTSVFAKKASCNKSVLKKLFCDVAKHITFLWRFHGKRFANISSYKTFCLGKTKRTTVANFNFFQINVAFLPTWN